MINMRSKYFSIEELVPKKVFELLGEDLSWELIDDELVVSLDTIKERFPEGTMTVNNWKWAGNREWSGVRTPDSPYYSPRSQHSFGRAIDAVFSHYDIDTVRNDIISNPNIYPHIKGIELGVSWLHVDTRERDTLLKFEA